MSILTKTVLAASAVIASASIAQANRFDPNLANRYPSYAAPGVYGYSSSGSLGLLHGQPVQGHDVALPR